MMGERGMDIERLPYRQASYGSFVQAMKNIAKFDYINKSRAQRAKRNETQRDALQKGETGGKTSNVRPPSLPYALLDGYVWRTPLFHLLLHISHHVATLARSLYFDCLLHLEEERNNRNGKTQKDLLLCQGGVQFPYPLPHSLFFTPSLNILPHTRRQTPVHPVIPSWQ